jgi:hypothetical protein
MQVRRNTHGNRRARFGSVPFNGNFASLFSGAYMVVQSDRGLTYGGTMSAVAGNTSTATMGITGTLATAPIPIWLRGLGGGTADIYYDGIGVTPAMAGVTWNNGVPIVLTGAGAGLTITPSAGTLVGGDTWKATCAALADQSPNGKNAIQVTASAQPIVTVGLNGKAGLLFDGVNDFLTSTAGTLLSAFPFQVIVVGRFLQPGVALQTLIGQNGLSYAMYMNGPNVLRQYCGSGSNNIAFSSTANTRFSAIYTGTPAASMQAGALSVTGDCGANLPGAGVLIASFPTVTGWGNIEVFAVILTPPVALAAFDAALNSAGGYGPGAIAV